MCIRDRYIYAMVVIVICFGIGIKYFKWEVG